MKIVNIIGGLGNQLFQYAFAIALKRANPQEQIYIDTHHFHYLFIKKWKTSNLHNGFELDRIFDNINLPIANMSQLVKVTTYMPNFVLSRIIRKIFPKRSTEYVATIQENQKYLPEILNFEGNMYYEGYWQAAGYYEPHKELLQNIFRHPQPDKQNTVLIEEISKSQSVGIHVRRGEYLKLPRYSGICEENYYRKAIKLIESDGIAHRYYIFTNDIDWCKQHICPFLSNKDISFVTHNSGKDSCWDMFLMTYCRNLIIANSSFSWWGAFLNKHAEKIIAPTLWMNGKDCNDIYAKGWIRI